MKDQNNATPPWYLKAACRDVGEPDEIFFPVKLRDEAPSFNEAKTYCDVCPVMYECLKKALDDNEWGTWGGMTTTERQVLRRTLKPAQYATVEQLQDLMEITLPKCSVCDRHRKEKADSGMCTTCFYAAKRLEAAKKKATCSDPQCEKSVYAKGRCKTHYSADLRAANPGAGAARSRKSRAKKKAEKEQVAA